MLILLALLCAFSAFGTVLPVGEIGKARRPLAPEAATPAAGMLVGALVAIVFVAVYLDGPTQVHVSEGFVIGSWLGRLFAVVRQVNRPAARPLTTGKATFQVAWNLAVLAALLYLLTKAV